MSCEDIYFCNNLLSFINTFIPELILAFWDNLLNAYIIREKWQKTFCFHINVAMFRQEELEQGVQIVCYYKKAELWRSKA